MWSHLALLKLRRLSLRFERLINKALKENIQILTWETYEIYIKKRSRYQPVPKVNKEMLLAAGNFPEIGLETTIVLSLPKILDEVAKGNLGMCELGFAHEIGHNLSWSDEPSCNKDFSSPYPAILDCQYFEALAYHLALQLLEQLQDGLVSRRFVYRGQDMRALDILHRNGYPHCFVKEIKGCQGLKLHGLKRCPKKKELEKLVKAIEQSKI